MWVSVMKSLVCLKAMSFSSSYLPCYGCDVLASDEARGLVDVFPNYPLVLNYVSFKGHGLDSEKMDFVEKLTTEHC